MWKPDFELPAIRSAVERAAGPMTDWQPLNEGENSQVFAAVANVGPVVVRVSKRRQGFAVDARASRMLAGSGIRVPEFHGIGPISKTGGTGEAGETQENSETEDAWWCLTGRLPGTRLCDLPMDRIEAAAPAVAETLERLHAIDVSGTTGYGGINPETGNGYQDSWPDCLLAGVPKEWPSIESIEDRKVLQALSDLVHTEPETLTQVRALIHGDCSADNLIIDEDGTVGVLDLECAMLGDPLWDLAYQLFWGGAWPQMAPQARAAVAALEDTADHRARLRFYMVTSGLAGTGFYAHDGRADDVHLMVRRLGPLAEEAPSLTELEDYWMCLGS